MTFKMNWAQMLTGTVLAVAIIAAYPILEREMNRNKPIDEWFNVRQLEVTPITPVGTFPIIVFDRTVGQDFDADWEMEIQSVEGDTFKIFCRASGFIAYKKDEILPNQGESIAWFTERFPDCAKVKDTLGRYRIVAKWDIDRGHSYYDYQLEKISNVFEIIDPDAFVPSKTQASINKTVKEIEAAIEAMEIPTVATSVGGVND